MEFFKKFNQEAQENLERQLNMVVSSLIGVRVRTTVSIKEDTRYDIPKKSIAITSENIADDMSPRMFKELKIENFGGNLAGSANQYVLSIHYRYTHFSSGSNGSDLAKVIINPDGSIVSFNSELV